MSEREILDYKKEIADKTGQDVKEIELIVQAEETEIKETKEESEDGEKIRTQKITTKTVTFTEVSHERPYYGPLNTSVTGQIPPDKYPPDDYPPDNNPDVPDELTTRTDTPATGQYLPGQLPRQDNTTRTDTPGQLPPGQVPTRTTYPRTIPPDKYPGRIYPWNFAVNYRRRISTDTPVFFEFSFPQASTYTLVPRATPRAYLQLGQGDG
ncbi:hypothetical protein BSL78_27284 [Apostichopus japonicus]|uniref:Uncharacterized protein n=1 Tax=Stichopus japonicus TaxID=307972 RepID=A0A2G8JJF7_STIJA|nr:hypothetical protein BSL78_27284 [Apostichopus japonicus]